MPPTDQVTGSGQSNQVANYGNTSAAPPETSTGQSQSNPELGSNGSVNGTSSNDNRTPAPPLENTVGAALEAFHQLSVPGVTSGLAAQTGQPTPNQPPAPQYSGYRKYDGLNAEDKVLFERMSNDAYNKLYPHYLESIKWREELDKTKAENDKIKSAHFYEQDNAYSLTPEYQDLSSKSSVMAAEVSHWEQQLQNIEEGKPWTRLVIGPNGQVMDEGVPMEATPQARAHVTSRLSQGYGYQNQYQAALGSFQEKFKGEHKNYVSAFDQMEAKIFAGADNNKLQVAAKTKLNLFPPHMQGRREIQSFAKALVLIDGLMAMLTQRQGAANTVAIKQQTVQSSGPTNGQIAPAASGQGTLGSVFDEFDRMKKGGFQPG